MSQLTFSRGLILILIVAGVYFTELGGARLWDRDEPRNSRASHEMLERGDWIVPTFNGELRTHKPILLYWGQMVSYLALGESEFTARLPSVLSALLAIAAVALLASRLSGHARGISNEGYWAAGGLATCMLFVMAGRAATPDACLIAFSTLGIAALVLSALAPAAPYTHGAVRSARWLPAIVGYVMLGLAVLAKGPVGIILPIAVVNIWWLICYELQMHPTPTGDATPTDKLTWFQTAGSWLSFAWRTFNPLRCLRCVWQMKMIPGVLVALVVCVPWYYQVGVETQGEFLRGFFLEHNLGRATSSMEGHGGSIFFYPVAFLVGTFPWSMWLIPIIVWCTREAKNSVVNRQVVILAAVWMSVYIGAFTIASTKLPSYITPCYAGAALVIGCYLRHFELGFSMPSRKIRTVAYLLTCVTGVAIAGTVLFLSSQEGMPLLIRASFSGVVIALVGVIALVLESRNQTRLVPATWLVGAAVFQCILFGFGAKSVDTYRQDLKLLADVKQTTNSENWLTIGGLEPSWVYYLQDNIVEIQEHPGTPGVWDRVGDFLRSKPDGKLIVVGADANEKFQEVYAQLTQPGEGMLKLGAAPRFMREGEVCVYGLGNPAEGLAAISAPSPSDVPAAIALPSESGLSLPVDAQPRVTVKASLASRPLNESVAGDLPSVPSLEARLPELRDEADATSSGTEADAKSGQAVIRLGRLPASPAGPVDERYPNPLRPSGSTSIHR